MDAWALARFDGTALYEHEDPRLGVHKDWGTHIFNYGRGEVKNFLLSSAHYWLSEFHLDGLRVDAVASMLYLDYSRKAGEWLPNKYGGREPGSHRLPARNERGDSRALPRRPHHRRGIHRLAHGVAAHLRRRPGLHHEVEHGLDERHPGLLLQGPGVPAITTTCSPSASSTPIPRTSSCPSPTTRSSTASTPCSARCRATAGSKFANLRLLLAYQAASPGKKLTFMGNEFGQGREWSEKWELDWGLLQTHWHEGVSRCVARPQPPLPRQPALHDLDFQVEGFAWIDCHDADQSVLTFLRRDREGRAVVVAFNFTPVPRDGYRLGVPRPASGARSSTATRPSTAAAIWAMAPA
jgi:1,4-alpha-glucan branching enzyme